MSWLTAPVRIIPALNTILDALHERAIYASRPGMNFGSVYEHFELPYSAVNHTNNLSDRIRGMIRSAYRDHFPPENFGKWSKLHPYGDYTDAQIDEAIAADLQKADIDPAGFFWGRPHLLGDGTFVRACYHLLNNVILYPAIKQAIPQTTKTRFGDIEYDGARNMPLGTIVGKFANGEAYFEHFDRRFVLAENTYPKLQGNWKAKRSVSAVMRDVNNHQTYQRIEYSYVNINETFEINFSGIQSDVIPWHPETLKNIDHYRDLCKEYYIWVQVTQYDNVSEICITAENFIPPNYEFFN